MLVMVLNSFCVHNSWLWRGRVHVYTLLKINLWNSPIFILRINAFCFFYLKLQPISALAACFLMQNWNGTTFELPGFTAVLIIIKLLVGRAQPQLENSAPGNYPSRRTNRIPLLNVWRLIGSYRGDRGVLSRISSKSY